MRKNVLSMLEEAADAVPQKIVYEDDRQSVSYEAFRGAARSVGSALCGRLDGQRHRPVAILVDRSVTPLIGFFGIVYSGNFYVPIDKRVPIERIQLLLSTMGTEMLLASKAEEHLISQLDYDGEIAYIEELRQFPADDELLAAVDRDQIDTDPLYAIFTSGSTGVPKAVLTSHRAVLDLVDQFSDTFCFDGDCVFGNQTPFDYDGSVKDIYSALRNRARMVVIPQVHFSFPAKLISYLNEKKINTIIWVASALRIVENLDGFAAEIPQYLRCVLFSGEVLPVKVLNYWKRYLPDVEYVNLYGPTEITCNCSYYIVDREFSEDQTLPVGVPFRNTDIFLLDGDRLITEPEKDGEICVKGSCLALGYYNNPEKTKEAFCLNPLNSSYPERIYRTGDIGHYDGEGLLHFVSRRDAQIKHMGHRIELGEIEAAVNALDFIRAGVCSYTGEEIVLSYEADEACDRELLRALAKKLPKYMMPTKLVWYARLPINKNGKIDRTAIANSLQK